VSLRELARFETEREATEVAFTLQAAGIEVELLTLPGNNGSPHFGLQVEERDLDRATAILAEEGADELARRRARRETEALASAESTARRRPLYWVVALVVANLATFIALEGRGGSERRATLLRFGASYAPALRAGEWWRTVTAVFLHIGARHLLANMISLLLFGAATLRTVGLGRFYALYLASGVAGNWVSFWLDPDLAVKAGASGAIFGMLGVLAAARIRGLRALAQLGLSTRFKTWHVVAAVLAFLSFVVGSGPVDHAAHFGGLVGGALLTFLTPRPGRLSPRGEGILDLCLTTATVVLAATAALLAYLNPA
jgi:membrane associated rhomboid family serine protease